MKKRELAWLVNHIMTEAEKEAQLTTGRLIFIMITMFLMGASFMGLLWNASVML